MLFIFAASFLAAHLTVLSASALIPSHLLVMLPMLLLIFTTYLLRGAQGRKYTATGLVFMLGVLNATAAAHSVISDRLMPSLEGQNRWVHGIVATMPRRSDDSLRFLLYESEVPGQPEVSLPRRIQVSWFRSAHAPKVGEYWRLKLRLRAPRAALNPGSTDLGGWYFREGIGARATVVAGEAGRLRSPSHELPVLRVRSHLAHKIRSYMDGHAMTGVITGLAVGIRDDISAQQWQLLRVTGTGHLVAISGLHVGLISGLAFFAMRFAWGFSSWLSSRIAPVDAARPFALVLGTAYALLAGFGLPAQRALIMLLLWYGAGALRRPAGGFQILWLCLIVSLCADPLCVLSPGFWLSFGAVATLILIAQRERIGRLRGLLLTQLKVFAGIAPIGLAVFGKISLVAPLANLVMIPWFSVVLIPLVLCMSFGQLVWPWLGDSLLDVCAGLLSVTWSILGFLGASQRLEFAHGGRSWLLPCFTVVGFLLLLPHWPGKRLLLVALVIAALHARPNGPPPGEFETTVLDVGHAMSVVVQTHQHSLVYDLGAGNGPNSDVDRILLPFLAGKSVNRPDILMLSHDDAHHFGDAAGFLRRFPGISVVSGAPVAARRRLQVLQVTPCTPGESWEWDGVLFKVLHPGREIIWEDDDSSCVLMVRAASLRILITGDLGVRGERLLLERYPDLRADVVIGLAHGSGRASSLPLVDALQARLALVSTRRGNPWGLPAAAVRDRWLAQGAMLTDTGERGAIIIRSDQQPFDRSRRGRRIWHRP